MPIQKEFNHENLELRKVFEQLENNNLNYIHVIQGSATNPNVDNKRPSITLRPNAIILLPHFFTAELLSRNAHVLAALQFFKTNMTSFICAMGKFLPEQSDPTEQLHPNFENAQSIYYEFINFCITRAHLLALLTIATGQNTKSIPTDWTTAFNLIPTTVLIQKL